MIAIAEVKSLVALENSSSEEVVVVSHYPLRRNRYRYTVTILGGSHDGIEFHCSTKESALWLSGHVLRVLTHGYHWQWLDWR